MVLVVAGEAAANTVQSSWIIVILASCLHTERCVLRWDDGIWPLMSEKYRKQPTLPNKLTSHKRGHFFCWAMDVALRPVTVSEAIAAAKVLEASGE
jgi:hypothetical protein